MTKQSSKLLSICRSRRAKRLLQMDTLSIQVNTPPPPPLSFLFPSTPPPRLVGGTRFTFSTLAQILAPAVQSVSMTAGMKVTRTMTPIRSLLREREGIRYRTIKRICVTGRSGRRTIWRPRSRGKARGRRWTTR